jgi:hypothetical protein
MSSTPIKDLDRLIARAERAISLLERCMPLNAAHEQRRLLEAWRRGERASPEWHYARVPDLQGLTAALEGVARDADKSGWGQLYGERALELCWEARAAACIGSSEFRVWAARRFPAPADADARTALAWAREWAALPVPEEPSEPARPSDDASDPLSLYSLMCSAVGAARLPFRVLLSGHLSSGAATGDRVILVAAGARFSVDEARRIVLHEIEGHALPRLRGSLERSGLFAVATAQGSDDEEGRALLLERRFGYLGTRRRLELGRRHLAALAVRDGADWVETIELLRNLDTPLERALKIAARAHRGGGLAREVVYLTALSRVEKALAADADLAGWLARGRISVEAARILRELGEPPELLRSKSAA